MIQFDEYLYRPVYDFLSAKLNIAPETNKSHLKIDAWKKKMYHFWVSAYFQVRKCQFQGVYYIISFRAKLNDRIQQESSPPQVLGQCIASLGTRGFNWSAGRCS